MEYCTDKTKSNQKRTRNNENTNKNSNKIKISSDNISKRNLIKRLRSCNKYINNK